MFSKKTIPILLSIILIMMLFHQATAQMRKVHKFKKVNVPFKMKHEDMTLEKGEYDFEIWVHRAVQSWQLKIIKKGKSLCILPGEVLRDRSPGALGEEMEDVPDEPTLKIQRVPAIKMAYIIFETGGIESGTDLFPYHKIRFKIEYE